MADGDGDRSVIDFGNGSNYESVTKRSPNVHVHMLMNEATMAEAIVAALALPNYLPSTSALNLTYDITSIIVREPGVLTIVTKNHGMFSVTVKPEHKRAIPQQRLLWEGTTNGSDL